METNGWQRANEISKLRGQLITAALRAGASAFESDKLTAAAGAAELDDAACALADKVREPEVCDTCGGVVPSGRHARTAGLAGDVPRNT